MNILGQEIVGADIAVIALLVLLEGVLSIDNALVLGLLAKRLHPSKRSRALTYGLVGAFAFRLLAVATASYLLQWRIVKLIGGGYLLYIAIRHLFFESQEKTEEQLSVDESGELSLRDSKTGLPLSEADEELEINQRMPVTMQRDYSSFWWTVLTIELTDIAFAVDSILAAIALVGAPPPGHPAGDPHPKLWLVVTGGMLGVILMRFAAVVFIRLLTRFPRFEISAYLLVTVIGAKLVADWAFNSAEHPHRLDFHSFREPEFWVFWVAMLVCFMIGFLPMNKRPATPAQPSA